MRGFCEKWAELDGFWWLVSGKKCGKGGLLVAVFWLLKACQFSSVEILSLTQGRWKGSLSLPLQTARAATSWLKGTNGFAGVGILGVLRLRRAKARVSAQDDAL